MFPCGHGVGVFASSRSIFGTPPLLSSTLPSMCRTQLGKASSDSRHDWHGVRASFQAKNCLSILHSDVLPLNYLSVEVVTGGRVRIGYRIAQVPDCTHISQGVRTSLKHQGNEIVFAGIEVVEGWRICPDNYKISMRLCSSCMV